MIRIRGVAQLGLECLTGGQEVAGSNPVAPSSNSKELQKLPNLENLIVALIVATFLVTDQFSQP